MQYADDYFHPSNQRDEVVDVRGKDKKKYSMTRISVPSAPMKTGLDEYENNNLCIFQLPMENGRKKYQVKCYKSGGTNTYIVNAVTGIQTRHLVGSGSESQYFKVRDTVRSAGSTFYYESPEAYERHLNTVLSNETKNRWLERRTVV
jgi:hypothetical protein